MTELPASAAANRKENSAPSAAETGAQRQDARAASTVGAGVNSTEQRCRTCAHWTASEKTHLGECDRWRIGYDWRPEDIPPNEVVVEGDEGWGAAMGPEFGCVLWEPKSP